MSSSILVVNVPLANAPAEKNWRFWLIILAISVSSFTSALDLTGVSTALPVIIHDLHGSQFAWIGSAYALSSMAFLPLSGGFAQVFGRRPAMLSSLFMFTLGSALCGSAPTMNVLIAARTIQGTGAGGITGLTQIILSDLVPLHERGLYNGIIGLSWAVASAIAPVIGGVLAQAGAWRWLFYISIFTSVLSGILVFFFLHLRAPQGTIYEKLARMDWIGNFIVVSASTSLCIALTWGGIQFPWSSAQVLVPLLLGFVGLASFLLYELRCAKHPIVPFELMQTTTGVSGYLQTFVLPIVLLAAIYYIPVYFQAVRGAGPVNSGLLSFGLALTIAPFNVIFGASVARLFRFRPQIYLGWCLVIIGAGLFCLLEVDSSKASAIGYQIVLGAGMGGLIALTYFPVLAPLPLSKNANALAFFGFMRNFGQIWGVTIGATLLQNGLLKRLPVSFSSEFPQGAEIAYSIIPLIPSLPPTLKTEVRKAFADSLRVVWQAMIGIGFVGLFISLFMKHIPLHTQTDEQWGLEQQQKSDNGDRVVE